MRKSNEVDFSKLNVINENVMPDYEDDQQVLNEDNNANEEKKND